MRQIKIKVYILLFILIASMIASCAGAKGEVSLHPTGLPLKITVDTNREISFSVEPGIRFPTPLGEVEAGIVISPSEYFSSQNPQGILTVRLDNKDYFYSLNGYDFELNFESGYYEKVNFKKTGEDIFLELVKREETLNPKVEITPAPTEQQISQEIPIYPVLTFPPPIYRYLYLASHFFEATQIVNSYDNCSIFMGCLGCVESDELSYRVYVSPSDLDLSDTGWGEYEKNDSGYYMFAKVGNWYKVEMIVDGRVHGISRKIQCSEINN